ncbi:MAG TPA: hypothetical protein VGL91_15810 [Acidobacteriota bacterium]
MFRIWATVLLLVGALAAGGQTRKKHRDYVPDEKTAKVIAEAVLVAQYSQERVNAPLPLSVDGSYEDTGLSKYRALGTAYLAQAAVTPCGLTSTRAAS